jgi:hypothetical protein
MAGKGEYKPLKEKEGADTNQAGMGEDTSH